MGSLHLEALYPAVAAIVLGILAFLKRTAKDDDEPEPDVTMIKLIDALGHSEAARQAEQAERIRLEAELRAEHAQRIACEQREKRRRP